ncbi:hypothetical protein LINPERHAP2_LOCUS36235 [Linum perenne]
MFAYSPLSPAGVDVVMAKFIRKPADLDEFQYGDQDVVCHCDVKASCRISHTTANPGRKFFGCRNYKSKANNGWGYFKWLDDKFAALNDKIALVNALSDRIALKNLIGNVVDDEESSSNPCEYNSQSEIEALKERVALLENIVSRSK